MPVEVLLVNMPYASVRWPSLGLGILHAVLQEAGFSVSALYANIIFADEIGPVNYFRLLSDPPENGAPDWTFAHAAFPGHGARLEEFLHSLEGRGSRILRDPNAARVLAYAESKAQPFIEHLSGEIISRQPQIVACSSSFSQHVASVALLRRIRERAPEIVTLMGGANCESVMGKATHEFFPWIDFVVSGEADELIVPLCRDILLRGGNIEADKLPMGVLAPIHRDIGYPLGTGADAGEVPVATPAALNRRPAANYDPYFETLEKRPKVAATITPGVVVEASRGCWWSASSGGCSFCGLNGCRARYRVRQVDQVLDELETLSRRHHIRRFQFVDNVLSPAFFKTLGPQLIARGAPYELFFEVRAGLSRDQVATMRQAGVIWVQAGIESMHTGALTLMNKGTECWQNIQLLKWLYQFGVRCVWNLLHDFPGEEDAWFDEMASFFPLLSHLAAPNLISGIRYSRFSALERHKGASSFRLIPAEPYRLIYPFDDHQLERLVYFFDDRQRLNAKRNPLLACILERPGLERLRKAREQWIRERNSSQPASLVMTLGSDSVTIRDTRGSAIAPTTELLGLARDIYLACDEAPTEDSLSHAFGRNGCSCAETERVIAMLVERNLLLRVDGRLVALALRDPVIPLQPVVRFPGGGLRLGGSPTLNHPTTRAPQGR